MKISIIALLFVARGEAFVPRHFGQSGHRIVALGSREVVTNSVSTDQTLTRRETMMTAAGVVLAFLPLTPKRVFADTDAVSLEEASQSSSTTYNDGVASFRTSSAWDRTPTGGFKDRFKGEDCVSMVAASSKPTALTTIEDLGKIERTDAAEVLGLPELKRADLVAASVRRAPDGNVYYSWDLALAPKECPPGDEFGGALGCSYDRIFLVSATVVKGKLHTLFMQAKAQEWKGHGLALRKLRDSFTVLPVSQ
mmetsp:Transcript_31326/g.63554  ORF Transcript_31326/g.63554 Transcript_31326/m.63554 type:complete len:252 (+) Transcript_31326:79-834(+)|eukprot:CAMPEP_0171627134 /NCGR_PEP_ID=MMETSP0990-20121206/20551_1 /TAXON_ID=483369 /ORGANISM="non described non described, Strain CCMP2098" /LENGTH=251 /DNA_ID=CAMNT_0012194851 /DNA_START=67 /DNA_END=822 /DNA_ORIENTATION=-